MNGHIAVFLQVSLALLSKCRLNGANGINEAEDWLPASGLRV